MYDKEKFKACVDWFKANRDALLPEHYGKYVACTADKLIGAWSSMSLAVANAVDMGYRPGLFAVHKCVPVNEEETLYFHTPRVDFTRFAL